jgi:hypothetical protein
MKTATVIPTLAALALVFAACEDQPGAGLPFGPEMAEAKGGVTLDVDVNYYYGVFNCAADATRDADGNWSFPTPLDLQFGGGACLTAQVMGPGNMPSSGYVLWEQCGDPGLIGPKGDCESGGKTWQPRTGAVWEAVDANGEVTTESFSIGCQGVPYTVGYRYRYSPVDPTDHPSGDKRATTFPAFDVTATGELCAA